MKKNDVVIENARIGFKNFSGKGGRFNPEGSRNFTVFLEPELADILIEEGWNVKTIVSKIDESEQAILQVKVSFGSAPPKIVLITSKGRTTLNETNVSLLDYGTFTNIDLIIRPYNWEVNGKTGIKAYLKTMYVTLDEDPLELKYSEGPDSALSILQQDADNS